MKMVSYHLHIWDYEPYRSRDGEEYLKEIFRKEVDYYYTQLLLNPKVNRVADESVRRAKGIELDLFYNPTSNISFYLDMPTRNLGVESA